MNLLPDSIISHGVERATADVSEGTCRICGPTSFKAFATKNGFHLGRCAHCDVVQVTEDLSNIRLEDYYDKEFFDDTYMWLLKEGRGRTKEHRKFTYRMEEIEALKPEKGRILDVGCSFGFFLDVARTRGWQTVGIDIGEYAVQFAEKELGLEVYVSDLRKAPMARNDFDVITMWNVVEHLDDPVREFRAVNEMLKPGGLVVFTTGDVDSYMRRMQGLRWRSFIPPIHVVNYNVTAITKLLEKTGFSVAKKSVALPREATLKRLHLVGLLKRIGLSDKMMIFARKETDL